MGAVHFSLDRNLLRLLTSELPLKTFVETGTFKGETLEMAQELFAECYSVELSPEYYSAAAHKFEGRRNIHLHSGSSPAFLAIHREKFSVQPVLFWLDAHWCVAEDTAGADSQSPLLEELQVIGRLHRDSVVLIDDARLYLCAPPKPHRFRDWPDFHTVVTALLALSADHRLSVVNDVIAFAPARIQTALARHAHEHGVDWLHVAHDARKHEERKRTRGLRRFLFR